MRRPIRIAALIVAAAAALAATATPVHAAGGRHCVLHLSDGGNLDCYRTFTAAIADATDGRITDAPADAAKAATDQRFKAELEALAEAKATGQITKTGKITGSDQAWTSVAAIVLSVHYVDINFGGVSLVAEGNRICTTPINDVDYLEPNLAQVAAEFNDVISSYTVDVFSSNCWVQHFEHANFGGLSTPYLGGLQFNIGPALNDKTTALRWS